MRKNSAADPEKSALSFSQSLSGNSKSLSLTALEPTRLEHTQ